MPKEELSAEANRFLAEASLVLTASLDSSTTLENVARLAVPHLADWCAVDLVEDGRRDPTALPFRQVAMAHVDPSKVELVRELFRRYPPDPNLPFGVPHVLRTGQPELYPEIPGWLLDATARDAAHLEILQALAPKSLMIAPMVARGRTLGAISFLSAESGRCYDLADLAMVEALARRAAFALDNARLYTDLERRLAESAALHEIGLAITSKLMLDDVLEAVYESIQRLLPLDAFYVGLYNYQDQTISCEILYDEGRRYPKRLRPMPVDPTQRAPWAREPRLIHRTPEEASRPPGPKAFGNVARASASLLYAPLKLGDQAIGEISVQSYAPNRYTPDNLQFLESVGQLVAIALDNARLHQEAQVSLRAQIEARHEVEAWAEEFPRRVRRAEEEERARLAAEMHDGLAQTLSYLHLQVDQAIEELRAGADAEGRLARVRETLLQAVDDVRATIALLHSPPSAPRPLSQLVRLAADEATRGTAFQAEVPVEIGADWIVPPDTAAQVVRVVQEALANACRHAGAGRLAVRLWQEGDEGVVCVEDNGLGFDPRQPHTDGQRRFGLSIMQARAARIGGQLDVDSAPGRGTRIVLRWPLEGEVE